MVSVIVFLVLLSVLFAKEDVDMMVWPIILAIVGCVITALVYGQKVEDFWEFIPIRTLLYLLFMDVFVNLMNDVHIFEYLALKIIHLTKSNMKLFYYIICIAASLLSGIMMDLSVALIFTPIVYRATKILNVGSKPYILGLEFSILIGNLLSPYATATTIIIADFFNLDMRWFITQLFALYLFVGPYCSILELYGQICV